MKERVTESFSVLKTTAIGGIFFLLPLIVVLALVGQALQIVWVVVKSIHPYMPLKNAAGYGLLLVIATLLVLLLCFAAGVVAKRSLGKRFTESVEKYLLMLFPRYAIFKEQLTGNIGGDVLQNHLKPVFVSVPEGQRLGMEVERGLVDGASRVAIFLPGSPDPWSGSVIIVDADRVQSLEVPFTEAITTAEQLGRGTLRLLQSASTNLATSP